MMTRSPCNTGRSAYNAAGHIPETSLRWSNLPIHSRHFPADSKCWHTVPDPLPVLNQTDYLEQAVSLTDDKSMKQRALLLCSDVYRSMGEATADREIALLEQNLDEFDGGDRMALASSYCPFTCAISPSAI